MIRVVPIIAVCLLLAFVAVLVARDRNVKRQRQELRQTRELIHAIYVIASQNRDIDPSAELIIMKINTYEKYRSIT